MAKRGDGLCSPIGFMGLPLNNQFEMVGYQLDDDSKSCIMKNGWKAPFPSIHLKLVVKGVAGGLYLPTLRIPVWTLQWKGLLGCKIATDLRGQDS